MKSSIKIAVNSECKPVIEVIQIESDDVRDTLIKKWKESLGYVSNWAKIEFVDPNGEGVRFHLTPVTVEEMEHEKWLMEGRVTLFNEETESSL